MPGNIDPIGDLEIYKALSDIIRLKILKLLSLGELCVSDIIEKMGESQSLVSHKLKNLRENGLVMSYRSGKNIIYRLSDDSVADFLKMGEQTGYSIKKVCDCVECEE